MSTSYFFHPLCYVLYFLNGEKWGTERLNRGCKRLISSGRAPNTVFTSQPWKSRLPSYPECETLPFTPKHLWTTFSFLNIPSWLEGIIGYPNCKQSPGITARMQVLETRQESCFKDGKGGRIERPGFPCLRSWETLEDEGEYVTWSEMWAGRADFDPGERCLAQVCPWWGSPRCRCQITLRLMGKLGSVI